jgi:hypothetical protein
MLGTSPTLFTPTRLARLPPMGAFLVLPAAGALWRRFLPKMSCASCSFLRFWRPGEVVSGGFSACRSAVLLTSLDDVVEGDWLFFAVGHCTVREDAKVGVFEKLDRR